MYVYTGHIFMFQEQLIKSRPNDDIYTNGNPYSNKIKLLLNLYQVVICLMH